MEADTLVTGGTGFLGRWLLAELTRRGRSVLVLARGGRAREPELGEFVDSLGGRAERVRVVDGDLSREGLGLVPEDLRSVRDVFHLAATFRFGMDFEEAMETNVEGALRALQVAATLPELRRFVHLGGYRTAGAEWRHYRAHRSERLLRALARRNGSYEASKGEATERVRERAAELGVPLTFVHPSAVIGDSRTGQTTQLTGLGEAVRDLARGKLPALAGTEATWVPLVAVDVVARTLASAPETAEAEGREILLLDPRTPTFRELMARVADRVGVSPPRLWVSPKLLRWVPAKLSGVPREALSFLVDDTYDLTESSELLARMGIEHPPVEEVIDRWVDHLLTNDFLEASSSAAGQGARAQCQGTAAPRTVPSS